MILIFASCKDENAFMPGDDGLTCYSILVSAPNNATRAYYEESGENIAVKWEKGDVIDVDGKQFVYKEDRENNAALFVLYAESMPDVSGKVVKFGETENGVQIQSKNNKCHEVLVGTVPVGYSFTSPTKAIPLKPEEDKSLLHIQAKSPAMFMGQSLLKINGLAAEYTIQLGENPELVFADKNELLDIYVTVATGTINSGKTLKFYFYAYDENAGDGKDPQTNGDEFHYYMKCNAPIAMENDKVVKMPLPNRPTHAAIQLGLSVKWATMNVGATSETDYGKYFWWGDVIGYEGSTSYNFSSTSATGHATHDVPAFDLMARGYIESRDTKGAPVYFTDCSLTSSKDAATQNWGKDWRMPTREDFAELKANCDVVWTTKSSVNGCVVTSKKNGKSIFLPAAAYRNNNGTKTGSQTNGYYLTSSLSKKGSKNTYCVNFKNTNEFIDTEDRLRYEGMPVRPVMARYKAEVASDIEGSLPGEFTVDKVSGKKVKFSKGNLQYQASTDTWRFAANQYDAIWGDNKNLSDSYSGWIDLFGWGTSGWNSGANEYLPWAHSRINADYYPGGVKDNNLTGDYAEADWGIHNAISNGGGKSGLWRVFTKEEVDCIKGKRSNTDLPYTKATVNDIPGVILYPDYLDKPDDVPITMGLNENRGYDENNISLDQWKILEFWGVVFLPITAYRNNTNIIKNEPGDGTDVVQYGEYNTDSRDNKKMTGSYWTSTCKSDNDDYAYVFVFKNKNGDNKISVATCERRGGCGVRLIHDVK